MEYEKIISNLNKIVNKMQSKDEVEYAINKIDKLIAKLEA